MPTKLSTTLSKIATVPNQAYAAIIQEYSRYTRSNGPSDSHQNNTIKAFMAYAKDIDSSWVFLSEMSSRANQSPDYS